MEKKSSFSLYILLLIFLPLKPGMTCLDMNVWKESCQVSFIEACLLPIFAVRLYHIYLLNSFLVVGQYSFNCFLSPSVAIKMHWEFRTRKQKVCSQHVHFLCCCGTTLRRTLPILKGYIKFLSQLFSYLIFLFNVKWTYWK